MEEIIGAVLGPVGFVAASLYMMMGGKPAPKKVRIEKTGEKDGTENVDVVAIKRNEKAAAKTVPMKKPVKKAASAPKKSADKKTKSATKRKATTAKRKHAAPKRKAS